MLIESFIAAALLALLLSALVIRWADAQYQEARRRARLAHRGR